MSDRCRTCDAEILWAVTTNGKRMPIDAEPSDEGTFVLETGDPPVARYVHREEFDRCGDRYVSHFSTCPESKDWRNKRRG